MKSIRMILTLSLILALTTLTASAQDSLSAKIAGSELRVDWSVACDGECTLTVYRDGWPLNVCGVCGEGSIRIPLNDAAGKYSVRLKTTNGCLTAEASGASALATPIPDLKAKPETRPSAAPTNHPTAKPASGSNRSALAEEVVRQVNAERARQGLSALRVDGELTRAACVRAAEIVRSFGHTRPNGTSWSTVSSAAYGENIAKGQRTADKVMAAWMSSQGHRENILRAGYGSIGVCAYSVDGIVYWVQLFGK